MSIYVAVPLISSLFVLIAAVSVYARRADARFRRFNTVGLGIAFVWMISLAGLIASGVPADRITSAVVALAVAPVVASFTVAGNVATRRVAPIAAAGALSALLLSPAAPSLDTGNASVESFSIHYRTYVYGSFDEGQSWNRVWTAPEGNLVPRDLVSSKAEVPAFWIALENPEIHCSQSFDTVEGFRNATVPLFHVDLHNLTRPVARTHATVRAVRNLAPTPHGGVVAATGAYPPPHLRDEFFFGSSDAGTRSFGLYDWNGDRWRLHEPWRSDGEACIDAVTMSPSGTLYGVSNDYLLEVESDGTSIRQWADPNNSQSQLWPIDCAALTYDESDRGRLLAASKRLGYLVSTDNGATWSAGIPGQSQARVNDVADCNEVTFAATTSGLYRTNAASRRRLAPEGRHAPPAPFSAIAVDPAEENHLLAGTEDEVRIFESDDGGRTWHQRLPVSAGNRDEHTPIPGAVTRIVFAASNPDVVYAVTGNPGLILRDEPPVDLAGVWQSADGGSSWEPRPGLSGCPGGVSDIDVYRNGARQIALVAGGVLYRSVDSGTTLETVLGPDHAGVFSVSISHQDPDQMVAGMEDGRILRSVDGGDTWTTTFAGDPSNGTVHSFARRDASTLYATVQYGGLLLSRDSGLTWTRIESDETVPELTRLCGASDSSRVLLATDGGGVWKLEGDLLRPSFPGPPGGTGLAVAQGKNKPRILCYADAAAGVFRSENGGRSYSRVLDRSRAYDIVGREDVREGFTAFHLDQTNPESMWAAAGFDGTVLYSHDGGASWGHSLVDPAISSSPVRVHALAGGKTAVFAAISVESGAPEQASRGVYRGEPVAAILGFISPLVRDVFVAARRRSPPAAPILPAAAAIAVLVIAMARFAAATPNLRAEPCFWLSYGAGIAVPGLVAISTLLSEASYSAAAWSTMLLIPWAAAVIWDADRPAARPGKRRAQLDAPEKLLNEIARPAFLIADGCPIPNHRAKVLFGESDAIGADVLASLRTAVETVTQQRDDDLGEQTYELPTRDGRSIAARLSVAPVTTEGDGGYVVTVNKLEGEVIYNPGGLSNRECEIAELIVEGLTYQEIADRLYIAVGTVRTHVHHIYEKTGASNRNALAEKLTTPSDPGDSCEILDPTANEGAGEASPGEMQ